MARPYHFVLLCAAIVSSGCASIIAGNDPGMEVLSDPGEATVFVNGNQRGTTPFRYAYTPEDGDEVNFEVRKSGYVPSTFTISPRMNNGVLFADAMLLGIPYIADSKSPSLYRMPAASYLTSLYKEVPADVQRQMVPVQALVMGLGDRPDLGKADGVKITTGSDGFFRELGYPESLTHSLVTGLKDSWMDAKMVRPGTQKGDELVQRAKIILSPKLERVHGDLKGQRRKCYGPIEMVMRWQFKSALDKDSVLFEKVTTTTYHAHGEQADQALMEAMRHSARRFSEQGELQDMVRAAYGAGLVRSKGEVLRIVRPKPIAFEGRKDMLAALVKAVVTVQTEDGHGSGFLVTNDGYMITNQHVVGDESIVKVKFEQGFTLDAQVVKTNKDYDVALLKVQATDLPALTIGDDKGLMLGEEIFAIGTPMETTLGQSVSRGILSGRRDIESRSLLQTDVSINPGNSGGPLIDEKGLVVGVATLKISGKGLEGLGFGVPISVALEMLNLSFVQ
ncbi:MAG: trypsin-like peptidase domain-containing protein [Flavobacteriales bacterium]|nr:trypsin-like peptidase domain-containing protein [Flavobacteriales bacterium]